MAIAQEGRIDPKELAGRSVLDRDGEKLGTIAELYYDHDENRPEWALVKTGLFGSKKSFVPIISAKPSGDELQVPVTKQQVKEAPRADDDQQLSETEERRLFQYYNVPYDESTNARTATAGAAGSAAVGSAAAASAAEDVRTQPSAQAHPAASQPHTADNRGLTRSEEEIEVGTAVHERGRVRLRKHVVTENVTKTLRLRHEEARVVREPITADNRAGTTPEIGEAEQEITLHEERPVVQKRTVPKERVRLQTDTHEDQQEVSDQVRKERIEVDGDVSAAGQSHDH